MLMKESSSPVQMSYYKGCHETLKRSIDKQEALVGGSRGLDAARYTRGSAYPPPSGFRIIPSPAPCPVLVLHFLSRPNHTPSGCQAQLSAGHMCFCLTCSCGEMRPRQLGNLQRPRTRAPLSNENARRLLSGPNRAPLGSHWLEIPEDSNTCKTNICPKKWDFVENVNSAIGTERGRMQGTQCFAELLKHPWDTMDKS